MFVNTEENLDQTFFKNKYIKEAFGITGEYDLLLKLKFKDVEEFNDFVIEFRKKHPVAKTITMVGTITLKEELN